MTVLDVYYPVKNIKYKYKNHLEMIVFDEYYRLGSTCNFLVGLPPHPRPPPNPARDENFEKNYFIMKVSY